VKEVMRRHASMAMPPSGGLSRTRAPRGDAPFETGRPVVANLTFKYTTIAVVGACLPVTARMCD